MIPKLYRLLLFLAFLKLYCEGFELKKNRMLGFDIGPPYKIMQNAYNNTSIIEFGTIIEELKYPLDNLTEYKNYLKTRERQSAEIIGRNFSKTQEIFNNLPQKKDILYNEMLSSQSNKPKSEIAENEGSNDLYSGAFEDKNVEVNSNEIIKIINKLQTGKFVGIFKALRENAKGINVWKTGGGKKQSTEIGKENEHKHEKHEQIYIKNTDDIKKSEEVRDNNIQSKMENIKRENDDGFTNKNNEFQLPIRNQQVEEYFYDTNAEENEDLNGFHEKEDDQEIFDNEELENSGDQNDEEFNNEAYSNVTEKFLNIETSNIISEFHEDVLDSSMRNDSIKFSEPVVVIRPKVFVDILNSSGSAFKQFPAESGENDKLLSRSARALKCKIPKGMEYSELSCTMSDAITCKQTCVFGYTLKQGVKRTQKCSNGKWSPSKKFSDCKPFVDCTVRLKSGGKKKCYSNFLNKPPYCEINCEGSKSQTYTCDIDGKWHPSLPKCAAPGTGQRLVPKPKMDKGRAQESKRKANHKEGSLKNKKKHKTKKYGKRKSRKNKSHENKKNKYQMNKSQKNKKNKSQMNKPQKNKKNKSQTDKKNNSHINKINKSNKNKMNKSHMSKNNKSHTNKMNKTNKKKMNKTNKNKMNKSNKNKMNKSHKHKKSKSHKNQKNKSHKNKKNKSNKNKKV